MGNKLISKNELETLAEKYEVKDFILDDPIQFPHRFNDEKDIEISAFIASLFAYGNRKVFINKLNDLFNIMQNEPYNYVSNFEPKTLKGFNYRFAKDFDVIEVFRILNKLYNDKSGLKELFEYGYKLDSKILTMLQTATDYFYSNVKNEVGMGFYHLIPNPQNGGAMKRMNMFLRWMVRKGPVDLGLWNFIPTSELLIPLDVHVARLSREMGLLTRSSNDFKAVLELSKKLKEFDSKDPIKYDFAIFGLGVNDSDFRISTSPLAGEDEFQHELESVRNSGEGSQKAHKYYASYIKDFAREMRKKPTPQEKKLWITLKNSNLGFKFRRQFAVDNKYIADFICLEKRIIIELDGGQHNDSFSDIDRTFYLKKQNFRIIRFWNNEIDNNFDGCIEFIINELNLNHC